MATASEPLRDAAARKARERIDVRLRPEQKAEIERAAAIKGLTLTDFIVQNALENAKQTIREHECWTLERPDAEVFAEALMAPATVGSKLAAATKRYQERFLDR